MAKILLVEDDNNLREIYEARLQAEGYQIISATNGEEALAVAKKERPDLIISDVMMPRISGFEMLDILRNTDGFKDTKVIMLTALGQAEDKSRADSLGADRYLVKSQVTLEDIVNAARDLLDGGAAPAPAAQVSAVPAGNAAANNPPAAASLAADSTPASPQSAPQAAGAAPANSTPAGNAPPAAPLPGVEPATNASLMANAVKDLLSAAQPMQAAAPVQPTPASNVTPPVNPTPPEPANPASPPANGSAPSTQPIAPAVAGKPTSSPSAPAVTPVVAAVPPAFTPRPIVRAVIPSAPARAPAQQAPAAAPAPSISLPQTQAARTEQETVQAQIDDFVKQPDPSSAPVQPTLTSNAPAQAENKAAVTNPTPPEPAASRVAPASQQPPSKPAKQPDIPTSPTGPPAVSANSQASQPQPSSDSVAVAHKKIIAPITDMSAAPQTDLNELLAKESGIASNAPGQFDEPHPPGHIISPDGR